MANRRASLRSSSSAEGMTRRRLVADAVWRSTAAFKGRWCQVYVAGCPDERPNAVIEPRRAASIRARPLHVSEE